MLPVVPAVPVDENLNPAVASFRVDELHYGPEFWELTYSGYRYLKSATVDELFERHEQIATNFRVFGTAERLGWPLTKVFSAWYWLRKEHQLRFEMHLRRIEPRVQLAISPEDVLRPMLNADAPYGDVLFRFSRREWLERTLSEGHLWLNAASAFLDSNLGPARADDERKKVRVLPGEHTKVTTSDGRLIPVLGDFTEWTEGQEYFLLSTASDYHPYMFTAFGDSDACLVINDARAFVDRMALSLSRQHPSWDFGEMLVHYYDPRELTDLNEELDSIKSKRFEYAFEMEWRFACVPPEPHGADHIELRLGPLWDIATIVPKGWPA